MQNESKPEWKSEAVKSIERTTRRLSPPLLYLVIIGGVSVIALCRGNPSSHCVNAVAGIVVVMACLGLYVYFLERTD